MRLQFRSFCVVKKICCVCNSRILKLCSRTFVLWRRVFVPWTVLSAKLRSNLSNIYFLLQNILGFLETRLVLAARQQYYFWEFHTIRRFFNIDEGRCDCHSWVYSSPSRLCKVNQQEFGRIPDTICPDCLSARLLLLKTCCTRVLLISDSIILPDSNKNMSRRNIDTK